MTPARLTRAMTGTRHALVAGGELSRLLVLQLRGGRGSCLEATGRRGGTPVATIGSGRGGHRLKASRRRLIPARLRRRVCSTQGLGDTAGAQIISFDYSLGSTFGLAI